MVCFAAFPRFAVFVAVVAAVTNGVFARPLTNRGHRLVRRQDEEPVDILPDSDSGDTPVASDISPSETFSFPDTIVGGTATDVPPTDPVSESFSFPVPSGTEGFPETFSDPFPDSYPSGSLSFPFPIPSGTGGSPRPTFSSTFGGPNPSGVDVPYQGCPFPYPSGTDVPTPDSSDSFSFPEPSATDTFSSGTTGVEPVPSESASVSFSFSATEPDTTPTVDPTISSSFSASEEDPSATLSVTF